MARKNWVGMLGAGVLIVLAIVSAACSGNTSNAATSSDTEEVKRSIKVYESPT
jgi:ABC-type glycerol-3-phosphate transport system substrate-binding protein